MVDHALFRLCFHSSLLFCYTYLPASHYYCNVCPLPPLEQHWQDLKFWYLQHLAQWLAHRKCWGNPCWLNKRMSSDGEGNIPEQRWSPSSTCWWKCWQGTGRERERTSKGHGRKKFFPALLFSFLLLEQKWRVHHMRSCIFCLLPPG